MAGEPPTRSDDVAPTAAEVNNGHWPHVSNYFAGHGGEFVLPHDHPGLSILELMRVHVSVPTGAIHAEHDDSAKAR